MKTIVVADAVMGLDNVLAVAGAAHGSFALVVIGLLVSIPIVIWGSQLILKYVERYPGIIYIGGAVLAWTAAKMIVSEPLAGDVLAAYPALTGLVYIAVLGGVLGGGFWVNHAPARARVAVHVVDPVEAVPLPAAAGMTRILLPVDASVNSLQAVEHVIGRHAAGAAMEVHLLHVRVPLSRYIARFLSRSDHDANHRQDAERALAPARDLLNRSGVSHTDHVEFGDKAETIRRVAQRLGAQQIVMGTARKNSLTRIIEDSVTNRVIRIVEVPVEVVVGRAVSPIEKIGLPAGLGVAAAVLIAVSLQ
jgi:nucleotide-binding universal stress UspA family protein